jgi:hypothetical protein
MDSFKPALFRACWAATAEPGNELRLITEPIAGREAPEAWKGHQLTIDIGQSQPRPPRDVFIGEHGVTCQISFAGAWSMVFLPWECIGVMAMSDRSFLACWNVVGEAEQPEQPNPQGRHLKAV